MITALVGFASSFTVVLAGLRAVGADRTQAASGLLTASVIMGLLTVRSALRTGAGEHRLVDAGRGAARDDGRPRGGFGAAVTAFALCGMLIICTGLCEPLRRLVLAVPRPLANALLAGVMLELCLVPVTTFRIARGSRWASSRPGSSSPARPTLGRPAAMLVALAEIVASAGHARLSGLSFAPTLTLTAPALSLSAVTLGVSLFIVTMASQNVPGIAVLEGFGYEVPVRSVLLETGAGTVAGAALGGHVVNLAAISAALCAGEEAHADPTRRWIASSTAGITYVVFGLAAGLLSALVAVAPAGLVESVAGLALLGTLGSALAVAVAEDLAGRTRYRDAAVVTFLVTASGATFAGIGSPFWGLLAGLVARCDPERPARTRVLASPSDAR